MTLLTHAGRSPRVDPDAWVAPDATVCGDVTVGPGTRILPGARVIGEAGGAIVIGAECIVMENAVIRATAAHPCAIGDNCLIGPGSHVVGALLAEQVFVATGAAVLHGASLGRGAEVRVHAVVHIRTRLDPGATVPIGRVAVGDPARILPAEQHDDIWRIQEPLDFPTWVHGLDRSTPDLVAEITRRLSAALGAHRYDEVVREGPS